jgi:hypothetical protein
MGMLPTTSPPCSAKSRTKLAQVNNPTATRTPRSLGAKRLKP